MTSLIFSVLALVMAARPNRSASPSPRAPAQNARPTMERAIDLYNEARFGESASVLDQLLRTDASLPQKKQARLYLAMNFLALGNEQQAKQQLIELFELDPDYELSTFVSPGVRQFFNQTRAGYRVIPAAEHTPPEVIDAAKGVSLEFAITRMRPAYVAKLQYRRPGMSAFEPLDFTSNGEDQYRVLLPSSLLLAEQSYALEYFLAISDEKGAVLMNLRSASDPFRVAVSVPPPVVATPVYKRWWFWTVIGGAVALAAAGTVVAVVLTQPKPSTTAPPPTTGGADVVITF